MFRGPRRLNLYRPFDLTIAAIGLITTTPLLVIAWIAAGTAAHGSGFFRQERIGRGGMPFQIIKFRTMRASTTGSFVTVAGDARITKVGRMLRRSKLDEVPQLFNVVRGEMALLGPRPDVAGFADELSGVGADLLDIRPGITGPASVLFSDEEQVLARAEDAVSANSDVIYPVKTMVNLAWLEHGSALDDLRILLWTVRPPTHGQIDALLDRWDPAVRTSEEYMHYLRLRGPT